MTGERRQTSPSAGDLVALFRIVTKPLRAFWAWTPITAPTSDQMPGGTVHPKRGSCEYQG